MDQRGKRLLSLALGMQDIDKKSIGIKSRTLTDNQTSLITNTLLIS